MSVYKQFTTQDVVITPFDATKTFSYNGDEIISSNSGIEFYLGKKPLSNDFVSSSQISTGITYKENTTGVYNSIKQLYYTNYLSSSLGDNILLPVKVPGVSSEYDETIGTINAPRFENYLQSTLTQSRYFPTQSEAEISVISIPSKLFGENIVPSTFNLQYFSYQSNPISSTNTTYDITDDGNGNLNYIAASTSSVNAFLYPIPTYNSFDITPGSIYPSTHYGSGFQKMNFYLYVYLQGMNVSSSQGITFNKDLNKINYTDPTFISPTASVQFTFRGITGQPADLPFYFVISSSLGASTVATASTSPFTSSINVDLYEGVDYSIYYLTTGLPDPDYAYPFTFDFNITSPSPYQYYSTLSGIAGQIFYSHGIATLTTGGLESMAASMNYYYLTGSGYGVEDYGNNIYGVAPTRIYPYLFSSSLSFMSSYRIYENQYKCTIRENEFNYTQNPSSVSGSGEYYYSFVTGSYFNPYATTIGLYNDNKELLVVGKLSQPIPLSDQIDTTFIVNFDI
jgi:hypothetical protein